MVQQLVRAPTFSGCRFWSRTDPFFDFRGYGRDFATIGEIRQVIAKYSRTGVPNIVNDTVYNELCVLSVRKWNEPLERMVDITLLNTKTLGSIHLRTRLNWRMNLTRSAGFYLL